MNNHPLTNGIAESIGKFRKQADITQLELSKRIGKSYSTIQKYELGLAIPPLQVLEDIADALFIDPLDLINGGR